MNGVAPSEVRDEMNANAARREALKAKLAAADEPPPLLHPEMARIWLALADAQVPTLCVGPRRLGGAAGVGASCIGIRRALRWLWSRK